MACKIISKNSITYASFVDCVQSRSCAFASRFAPLSLFKLNLLSPFPTAFIYTSLDIGSFEGNTCYLLFQLFFQVQLLRFNLQRLQLSQHRVLFFHYLLQILLLTLKYTLPIAKILELSFYSNQLVV